jgi:hypothetical protein
VVWQFCSHTVQCLLLMEWEVVEARGRGGGGRWRSTVVVMHTCERRLKSTMPKVNCGSHPNRCKLLNMGLYSVTVARIFHFCKSNKIDKILKILEHIDLPKSQWVLCKH